MKKLSILALTASVCLLAAPAMAAPPPMELFEAEALLVQKKSLLQSEVIPQRPLVLVQKQVNVYSGIYANVSKDSVFKGWMLPIGGGMGLMPNLEIGFDTSMLLKPFESSYLFPNFSFYGRYMIIPRVLAAQLTVRLPTQISPQTGFEFLAPMRHVLGPLEVFGQVHFDYYAGSGSDSLDLGLSVSFLYTIMDSLFVGLDTGFTFFEGGLDSSIDNSSNLIVPLGLGVGYRVSATSFLKFMFSFNDIASKDATTDDFNGLDSRVLLLTYVQTFDMSPYCVAPSESGFTEIPTPAAPAPAAVEATPAAEAAPADAAAEEKKPADDTTGFGGWGEGGGSE